MSQPATGYDGDTFAGQATLIDKLGLEGVVLAGPAVLIGSIPLLGHPAV